MCSHCTHCLALSCPQRSFSTVHLSSPYLTHTSLVHHQYPAHTSSNHNLLGLTGPDLQSMDVMTAKELKLLENVLEVEVPKLRRMVGPSMGTMSDPSEKTKFISG